MLDAKQVFIAWKLWLDGFIDELVGVASLTNNLGYGDASITVRVRGDVGRRVTSNGCLGRPRFENGCRSVCGVGSAASFESIIYVGSEERI
jgi:hypothetical protein